MALVATHPTQEWAVRRVGDLLSDLRQCSTPTDYFDLQLRLLNALYTAEERRSRAKRNWMRVRRGKGLTADAPDLPQGADPLDVNAWRREDLVLERAARQLRSVGDALAWRVSAFDRRYVTGLAQNASAGPIANKTGLEHEILAVQEIWTDRGHFALLHDLTGCLRIGDITEFQADGNRAL